MRFFLVLALAVGLVYLGMQVSERVSSEGLVREVDGLTPVFERSERQQEAGAGATSEGPREDGQAIPVEAAGHRWSRALQEGDYKELTADAELRSVLPLGTAGRLSLEVALARMREDGIRDELLQAADRLALEAPGEAVRLTASAFRVLSEGGRLEAALSSLGSSNRFLRDPGSASSVRSFLARVEKLADDERKARILSRCIEKFTRGDPFFSDPERFAIVRMVYERMQPVLSRLVFSRNGAWRSKHYKVKPGESFDGIAQKHERELGISLAPGFLQMVNGYSDPRRLKVGDMLRIPTARMRVVIEKGTHVMRVYLDEILVRLYQVGLGKDSSTPEGRFVIEEKQIDPVWYPPEGGMIPARSPENVLGRYFLKLRHPQFPGYGIHGTDKQETVGKNLSRGCIRLRRNDMDEVFRILPRGTEVEVQPSLALE